MAIEAEDECNSDRLAIFDNAVDGGDNIAEDNSNLIEFRVLVTNLYNFPTTHHLTDMNRLFRDPCTTEIVAKSFFCHLVRLRFILPLAYV